MRRRPRSSSPRKPRWLPRKHSLGYGPVDDNASENSEKNLVDLGCKNNFDGIHVSNEVHINVKEVSSLGDTTPDVELTNMGFSTEASVGNVEAESFADELMAIRPMSGAEKDLRNDLGSKDEARPPSPSTILACSGFVNLYESSIASLMSDSALRSQRTGFLMLPYY